MINCLVYGMIWCCCRLTPALYYIYWLMLVNTIIDPVALVSFVDKKQLTK